MTTALPRLIQNGDAHLGQWPKLAALGLAQPGSRIAHRPSAGLGAKVVAARWALCAPGEAWNNETSRALTPLQPASVAIKARITNRRGKRSTLQPRQYIAIRRDRRQKIVLNC
jgi:hypothetical protein